MNGKPWTEGALLAPLTSWRIGGACRVLAEPETPEDLTAARREAERHRVPFFLLGGGSNLLFADEGYPGIVARYLDRARTVTIQGDTALVRAGARAALAGLARETARAGWAGLEWAEGIPGTVAGAAVCNAGAYGGEIAGVLESLEVVLESGEVEIWPAARMAYAYRSSILKGHDPTGPAIAAVTVRLHRDDAPRLEAEVTRIARERRSKTPVGASCGSVFKNPAGDSAGRLIDAAGCKSMRRGGAVVSPIHANYIVNDGAAAARDVLALIEAVRERVRQASGIDLELEIQPVGFRLIA